MAKTKRRDDSLDVKEFRIRGQKLDATPDELDFLDGSVAGTSVASKALVLGANKNTDVLVLPVSGLKIGSGAGTAMDLSAAELNKLDGAPLAASFVVGEEAGNVINVAVQLQDGNAADIAVRGSLFAYLSDDANGDSLTAAAPDGGWAIGTDGLMIPVLPSVSDSVVVDGNLAIDAVAEKFKTTQALAYFLSGVLRTKAATTALVFSAAHVITASKFGVIAIQIDAAGNISTKVPGTPQAYDDAPTALAALPAADSGNVRIGYIAIENNAGDWTANTDDLTDASDVTTAAFTDTTESVPVTTAKAAHLTSESDGDIDLNLTHAAGAATWYLVLRLPTGKLAASAAITFA